MSSDHSKLPIKTYETSPSSIPAVSLPSLQFYTISERDASILKSFVNRSILWRLNEIFIQPKRNDEMIETRRMSLKGCAIASKARDRGNTSGKMEVLARTEYRTVSVLFVKIHSAFDPDRAQSLLAGLLSNLEEFDGVFQQYCVDDKGQSMLACFGLPSGLFAVKAATLFAKSLTDDELYTLSISITTGDILFGTVGTENRRDAALLGDVVNVAARLLGVGGRGDIVVDEKTKNIISDIFEIDDLGFFTVNQKEVISDSLWVQNKIERDTLDKVSATWLEGGKEKSIFLIEGESGMGKSTLLTFLQKTLRSRMVGICISHGSEVDNLNSYLAIREIFLQLLQIKYSHTQKPKSSLTLSSATTSRKSIADSAVPLLNRLDLERTLVEAKEDPRFAELLLELITGESVLSCASDAGVIGKGLPPGLAIGGGRRSILKTVLVKVVSDLCRKHRVAILLDDCQWIDAASLEIFNILAEEHPSTFMALFSRPVKNVDSGNHLHKFLTCPTTHHMPLAGMSKGDLEALLIYNHSSGNLLQTDSLIRYLTERSHDVVYIAKNGELHWRSPDVLNRTLARSVEMVVMAQFDRLHPEFQNVLRHASILGQYFGLFELNVLMGGGVESRIDNLRTVIDSNDQFGFLKKFGPDGECDGNGEYYFRHITIMNAIYQSVAFSEREDLHLQVARYFDDLIQTNPGRKNQILPTVCYHYWRTRCSSKIIERVCEMGVESFQNGLLNEASKTLESVNNYIDEHRSSLQSSLTKDELYLMEPIYQCRILAFQASAKASMKNFQGSKDLALRCLDLADIKWPTTPKATVNAIIKALGRCIKYWRLSKHGHKNIKVTKNSPKEIQPLWSPIYRAILKTLQISGGYGGLAKEHILLVIVWSFTHSIATCETELTYLYEMVAFASYVMAQQASIPGLFLAKMLARRCESIKTRCSPSDVRAVIYLFPGLLYTLFGRTRDAVAMVGVTEEYWTERRVKFEVYKTYVSFGVFSIYFGDLLALKHRLTDELLTDMRNTDMSWFCATVAVAQHPCFLRNDFEAFQHYREIYQLYGGVIPLAVKIRMGSSVMLSDLMALIMGGCSAETVVCAAQETMREAMDVTITSNHHLAFFLALTVCVACTSACCNKQALASGPIDSNGLTRSMVSCINECCKRLRSLAKFSFSGYFSVVMLSTAKYHLLGKASNCVKIVRRFMKHKEYQGKLNMSGDLCFVGAFCCAIISLSSHEAGEVRGNFNRALQMFGEMGADLMQKWVRKEIRFKEK
ncbi:hypothetical protein HDU67_002085 [Dinochytrium kinnereticum]|nr:hypothetical protein HDU67_002085 [Dinochytrium kinnereticum]